MKKLIIPVSLLFLASCGGWSDSDIENFQEKCEKAKFNRAYCDCLLDKAMDNYSTFDEMTKDEEAFAETMVSCIEEDREEEK